MFGCFSKVSASFKAFSLCLYILKCKVSSPLKSREALNGLRAAPKSLKIFTLALIIYARFPKVL